MTIGISATPYVNIFSIKYDISFIINLRPKSDYRENFMKLKKNMI